MIEDVSEMNIVILLAAGKGLRIGGDVPKQHIIVNGHQIIEYTLLAFSSCDAVDAILVVCNTQYKETIEAYMVSFPKLKWVIDGGETRIRSAYNGVKFLQDKCSDTDKIIISDGVRPCITHTEIRNLYSQLDYVKAATTAIENYEMLLKVSNGVIEGTIPRDGIARQTSPEAYMYETLKKLYLYTNNNIDEYRYIGLDLLAAMGEKIPVVKSNAFNFKITTPDELEMFEYVLKKGFDTIINR